MRFAQRILSSLFFLMTLSGNAQITLNAPTSGANYQWFHNGSEIVGATANTLSPTNPGTYHATFEGTNSCQQTTSYFVLVDNCTLGNEVDLLLSPNYAFRQIRWSNGNIGQTNKVTVTPDFTSLTAIIDLDTTYSVANQFLFQQFDTTCCTIQGTGVLTLIPSNGR